MKLLLRTALRSALAAYRRRPKRPALTLEELVSRYDVPKGGVLHIGGNDGSEAAAYERCGFERVVWIEGHHEFYQALLKRIAVHPGQEAHEVVVSDVEGEELEFHVTDNRASSTVFRHSQTFDQDFPNIAIVDTRRLRGQRLDIFFQERGVDLSNIRTLVVDLEGSELKALVSLGNYLTDFDFAMVEVSIAENYVNGPRLKEIDRFMLSKGFLRAEARMGSSSGDAFYVRGQVSFIELLSARASSLFYEEIFYKLYRHNLVKGVKRFLRDSASTDDSST